MSETRVTDPNTDVDQKNREIEIVDEPIDDQSGIVEEMKRQLAELEERDRKREDEIKAERQRASDAQRAREAAEARARDADARARDGADTAARSVDDAQFEAISTSLTAATDQMNGLKGQYKTAFTEGDADKLAEIQANMALLGSRITTLEAGKRALEARKATPDAQRRQETQSEPSESERQETFIRGQPPRVQDWLRANRERYFNDTDFQQQVAAAAGYAQRIKRLDPGSQEYIDYVDYELGLRQRPDPVAAQTNERTNQPAGRNPEDRDNRNDRRMVTAPAGGSVPNTAQASGGTEQVYLTREEKEQARRDGITEAEWAKAKLELIREGQLGPNRRNR
jgi:hypothetical protein